MPDNLPEKLKFYPWRRPNIYQTALPKAPGERLSGSVTGEVTDGVSDFQNVKVDFDLIAPADIAGIRRDIIVHTAPKANETNAETTKFVHVDFRDSDFAWRYTPQKEAGPNLDPWLVLLVGRVDELRIDNDKVFILESSIFAHYPLDQSKFWAHVQHDGASTISRLLSPYPLPPQSEMIAAVVPAFGDDHEPMWNPAKRPESLPVFYWWRFWTAEAGDFETLSRALRLRPATQYNLGKAQLHYHRNLVNGIVNVHGAITMIQQQPPDEPDLESVQADLTAFKQELDALEDDLSNPEGIHRNVISLPTYGRPWTQYSTPAAPNDWAATLNTDPRFRGSGGIGLEMGIQGQKTLVDAAVQQLGAIDLAAQKVRNLAWGLLTGGTLWARHLPQDAHARLVALSPLMRRMRTKQGTALGYITQTDSPLTPAMFSSAARRVLRPGTARTIHSADGPLTLADFLQKVNTCPDSPTKRVDGLSHIDDLLTKLSLAGDGEDFFEQDVLGMRDLPQSIRDCIEALVGRWIDFSDETFVRLVDDLNARISEIQGCESPYMYFQQHQWQEVDRKALYAAVRACFAADWQPRQDVPPVFGDLSADGDMLRAARDRLVALIPEALVEPCNPPDIDHVVSVIADAVDPRGVQPPAWRRVAALIDGIDLSSLAPPEVPIGIHFPTWTLLNQYAKEWLLPGIGDLPKDSIVALQTNPAFIDAYMVGINQQFMDELHWRNIPVDRTCTPLLMFWGHIDFETIGDQSPDIRPIRLWDQHTDLGDNDHQVLEPGDSVGKRDLVIIFKTDLFRRYPKTMVYLVNPDDNANPNADLTAAPAFDQTAKFRGPIFQGELEPDVVFFAFNIDPTTLDQYWLVLDEPPSELRFRNDILTEAQVALTPHSAQFAANTIDTPTRVAFDGRELEALGSEYD